jgi:transcriptional regulator with XRE-family HTH domain
MLKNGPKRLSPLARHRRSRGISQKEFARRLNVHPTAVCAWESGKWRPDPKRVRDIADQLGRTPLEVEELIDAGFDRPSDTQRRE